MKSFLFEYYRPSVIWIFSIVLCRAGQNCIVEPDLLILYDDFKILLLLFLLTKEMKRFINQLDTNTYNPWYKFIKSKLDRY